MEKRVKLCKLCWTGCRVVTLHMYWDFLYSILKRIAPQKRKYLVCTNSVGENAMVTPEVLT